MLSFVGLPRGTTAVSHFSRLLAAIRKVIPGKVIANIRWADLLSPDREAKSGRVILLLTQREAAW